MEKMIYLRERKYNLNSKKNLDSKKREFWEILLGKELFNDLYKNRPEIAAYIENKKWDTDYKEIYKNKNLKEKFAKINEKLFREDAGYFEYITETEKLYLQKYQNDVLNNIFVEFKNIVSRIFIIEMKKMSGQGYSEYDSWIWECLRMPDHRSVIFAEYPVLERCLWECASRNITFFTEVLNRIEKDKKVIEKTILAGEEFQKVESLDESASDSHFSGKRVLKLKLDNGKTLIYKPHSIENEKWFCEFVGFLGKKCGITMYFPDMMERGEYGWIECIEQRECENREELKRYYYRIGIELFAAYLLGTNDIHCENLIAMGEYPVIVDLESLGRGIKKEKIPVKKPENLKLQETVLTSGILPYYRWVQDGKGVDLSALTGGDDSETSFKVPVIKNQGTAEMYVDYEYAKVGKAQNHAKLKGKVVSPDQFEKDIICGFETAFQYTLDHKEEIRKWIEKIENFRSRCLVGDTQKYSMLLSSSYHPAVMKDAADREFLLYSLWRGREFSDETDCKIVDGEIYDLLNNDIPYFYFYMNRNSLYDSRGNEIAEYFEEAPIEKLYKRLDSIDRQDLKRQERLIHLSLSAAGEEVMPEESKYHLLRKMMETPEEFSRRELLDMAEKLADKLLEEAERGKEQKSFNWFRLMVMDRKCGAINIYPCGMYLYDGISGILIFLHILSMYSSQKKYMETCGIIEQQLFAYTDTVRNYHGMVQSGNSGLYNGEGSVVYAYLILYWISGKKVYLEYAEKHAEILERVVENDMHCDLLDGKAGAVLAWCYLYTSSHRQKYLALAEQTADRLIAEAEKSDKGYGWKQAGGGVPLLGMAHGNAGIMAAVSKLYGLTGKETYYFCMKEALRYEDRYYNLRTEDWLDFRSGSDKINLEEAVPAAWCHGAGGILLSRIILAETKLESEEQIYQDIERAYTYLKKNRQRDDKVRTETDELRTSPESHEKV